MPEEIINRIVRLEGYEVFHHVLDETALTLMMWVRQNAKDPYHTYGACGIGVREIHSWRERPVRDLPWGEWKVWLVVEVHRVVCPRCGVKTEHIDFLEGKHPYTKRFTAAVARECEDASVNRVAARWQLSISTVRRIDKRSLEAWSHGRPRKPLRWMAVYTKDLTTPQ